MQPLNHRLIFSNKSLHWPVLFLVANYRVGFIYSTLFSKRCSTLPFKIKSVFHFQPYIYCYPTFLALYFYISLSFIHVYKNIVFMPRLNIIIFLPILSWNWIFLWILLNYNVWHFRFIDFDPGVEVQFWSQTASDEGLIWHKQLLAELLSASVKQASCAECVVLWLVCRLEKGGIDTIVFLYIFWIQISNTQNI